MTANEKIADDCSKVAIEVQASEDDNDWAVVGDDAVKKAIDSKQNWFKKMENIQEEFMRYKTMISTWCPEQLDDEDSDFNE